MRIAVDELCAPVMNIFKHFHNVVGDVTKYFAINNEKFPIKKFLATQRSFCEFYFTKLNPNDGYVVLSSVKFDV